MTRDWFASNGGARTADLPNRGPTRYGSKSVTWGDTVVVTSAGARRLGALPQQIIVVD